MSIDWIPDYLKGQLEEPVGIEFSEWTPWEERNSIPYSKYPGVYLIARFDRDKPPFGPAAHTDNHVIYVGVTGTRSFKTLRSRWNAFQRSALQGKSSHAGGNSYRKSELPQTSEGLYVAAYAQEMPLNRMDTGNVTVTMSTHRLRELLDGIGYDPALANHLNCAWRLYMERRCLFEYVLANNGKLPLCNKE